MTDVTKPAAKADPINFDTLDLSQLTPGELHQAGVANGMTQKQIAVRLAAMRQVPIEEFCAQYQRRF